LTQEGPTDSERRWAAWRLDRNRRGLRTALWLALLLYPGFGLLDVLIAPRPALPWLLGARGVVTVISVAMFRVVRTRAFEANAEWITSAYCVLGASLISFMTVYVGGLASPYYAGLMLYIVGIGLLFIWPARVVAVTNSSIVASLVLANLARGTIGSVAAAASNLAFLSAIALIASVGQVVLLRTHREQHDQRMRIEQATLKLERAHAELRKLDEFKSRFFANMTHELRTPLAMILTPLELLLQGEMGGFSDAARASFNSMFKNALKLLKLINDLLDLSRLEESRLRLHVAEHEVVGYLRTLTEQTEVLAKRRGIVLTFRPAVKHSTIRCDLERLERVFVNLLSNAIKFTPPQGHVDVSISAADEALEIAVQDDGPGFAPDKSEKIFERFYQVDMEGTRQHGGAGIGLALARELIELHGGTIRASSDGKHGARFVVTLPTAHPYRPEDLVQPQIGGGVPSEETFDWTVQLERRQEFRLLDIDEATERRVVERDADESTRPYTVVVVEDNPQVLQVVHMSLRRQFKVLTAPDGLKGLEMAEREQPNLVVTDLMMPGMDGLELTRRIRADQRLRHIPVLMLTARGALEDRVKGLETGVSAYLTKPFSPRELITCARQLVRAEEQTADLVLTRRMESVELVAAGLAHEINNPLNYVKTALARVGLDVEQATAVAAQAVGTPLAPQALAQVERAAARIREMLGVAGAGLTRIAGTVELLSRYGRAGFRRELGRLDAWDAVRTVVDIVRPATGRDVAIELDLRGDGTLECVAEEFNQVLTNLVQNAIEAVPDGTGRVRVAGSVDGDEIVISVRDNGPGVPPDVQARLFTPFFTTKGPGRGMGLGLTITRRVVQALGGGIQLVSSAGAGAEFIVRVPRRQARREPAAAASPSA
jgi:signal transduction histidine kinase